MVNYTVNVSGFDRSMIAEEVMASAARVLMASGFAIEEVAILFREAGEQIETGEAITLVEDEDHGIANDSSNKVDKYDLTEEFEELPSIKALNRLAKRSDAIDALNDQPSLIKAVTLITEALPLRRKALVWLSAKAIEAGLQIAASRELWIETASDDELDDEEQVIFLDDYRYAGDFNWQIVSQAANALASSGEQDYLLSFGQLVLDEEIYLESRVRDEVREALEACKSYKAFTDYVLDQSGQGELAQSEFLDSFVRDYSFSGGTYMLQNWLDSMAAKGLMERYKRSNRWRIVVS